MNRISNSDLIHMMNQRSRLFTKELNNQLEDYELYTSQWSILFCIDRFGPMPQTNIWKYLNVEAPTVTRTLARMEEKGWITRRRGKDRRERIIELTTETESKLTSIKQTVDCLEKKLLGCLSTTEKNTLYDLLNKIGNEEAYDHEERTGEALD